MKNLLKKIYKIMIINFFLFIYKKIDQKTFLKNNYKINFLFKKKNILLNSSRKQILESILIIFSMLRI